MGMRGRWGYTPAALKRTPPPPMRHRFVLRATGILSASGVMQFFGKIVD